METLLQQYGYALLYPLVVLEGPFVGTIAGFFIFTGHFTFLITILVIVAGDITSDVIYFTLGKRSHKSAKIQRYIDKMHFLKTHVRVMNSLWERKIRPTMFLGKNAYTLSTMIIISAGMSSLTPKRFFSRSIPVSLLQTIILVGIGYYLGNSYYMLEQNIQYPFLILMVAFVIFFLVYKKIGAYATDQLENEMK